MTRLVLDAATAAKLQDAKGRIELCDDSGQKLGVFYPSWYEELSEEDRRGPFSAEELERRRKEPGGKPLSEILKRLEEL
jgi:hypothetical protein